MLSLQNKDGGWPSYENMRSGAWMEWLNPSECFGIESDLNPFLFLLFHSKPYS
jgi:squalene cyclase